MSPAERAAFLDRETAGAPGLRAEVERLHAANESAGTFLAGPAPAPEHGSIGSFRLHEVLGEGGFGVVYLAEQTGPIRRRVALKLIKPGMDTKHVIARFETERQALALMDHPGIAKVFDAGETEVGRPYFTMEYVDGLSITSHCDQHRLPVRERLTLFLAVCDAIQHAHQKGVIHRDLKPSNILVAEQDGVPVPKIIDFGIAKAVGAGLEDRTRLTREGAAVGTLECMSPEQAGAIAAGVDTRTDIYSLGVVLYELLTGAPPFDAARLRAATWTDAVRMIRDEDAPTLTKRLGQLESVSAIAPARRSDPAALRRELRGDLEWITGRAIEKDPGDRYASASELGADIHRFLVDQPVLAGAPSTSYRVRKFVRRHRLGVSAAALVLLAIVAGGVAAGVGLTRAIRAEREAVREAESANRVTDFLVDLFEMSTPDRALGETVTARTLLDVGARGMQGEQIDDPRVRSRLLTAVGSAYAALGLQNEAVPLLREAVDAARAAGGEQSAEFGKSLSRLARGLETVGGGEEAGRLLDRSIEILARSPERDPSALALAIVAKARREFNNGRGAASDSLLDVAVAILEGTARPDTAALVTAYSVRGHFKATRRRVEDAVTDDMRALSLATALYGEHHSKVVSLHGSLAMDYMFLDDPEHAMHYGQEGLRLARAIFPSGHPSLGLALSRYGEALYSAGRWDEAVAVHEEALGIFRACYGAQHALVENELYSIALCHESAGEIGLAIDAMREGCEIIARLRGPQSAVTAARMRSLGSLYNAAGRFAEADSVFRMAIPNLDPTMPLESAAAHMELGNACRGRRRDAEADSLYRRAEALFDTTSAAVRVYYGECLTHHAYLRALQGRFEDAEAMMQRGIDIQLETDPEDSPNMLEGFVLWAASRARAGDEVGAIEALGRAVKCGPVEAEAARYPELAKLRGRPDYPLARGR